MAVALRTPEGRALRSPAGLKTIVTCGDCCDPLGDCSLLLRMHCPERIVCGDTINEFSFYLCPEITKCIGGGNIVIGTVVLLGGLCCTAVEEVAREDLPNGARITTHDELECNPDPSLCEGDIFVRMVPCDCKVEPPLPRKIWLCIGELWNFTNENPGDCFILKYVEGGERWCLKPSNEYGQPDFDAGDRVVGGLDNRSCCDCCESITFNGPDVWCVYDDHEIFVGEFCLVEDCVNANNDRCKLTCCCNIRTRTGTYSGMSYFENDALGGQRYTFTGSINGTEDTATVHEVRWNQNGVFFDETYEVVSYNGVCHPRWPGIGVPLTQRCDSDSGPGWRNDINTGRVSCRSGELHTRGDSLTGVVHAEAQLSMRLSYGANVCDDRNCSTGLRDIIDPGGGRLGPGGLSFTPIPGTAGGILREFLN